MLSRIIPFATVGNEIPVRFLANLFFKLNTEKQIVSESKCC